MPDSTCPTCGAPMRGDDASALCSACSAAAIAKPEHAQEAKVTPPSSTDGAIREGEPAVQPGPERPWPYKHEPGPSFSCLPFIIVGGLTVAALVAILIPACSMLNSAVTRGQTISNMKQITLACHAFHDTHKRWPTPAMIEGNDGNARTVQLSWRVSILPFMDANPLFNQMDRTVGWDHPRNAPFQDQMYFVYLCPYRDEAERTRRTYMQYFTGPGTLFPANTAAALNDIKDGSSNQFLFADADQPVIWTRPADMAIHPDRPLPLPENQFFAAMADGTIRTFDRRRTSDIIVRQLIHPNDQKPDAGWDN